jgi:hypothetical protein
MSDSRRPNQPSGLPSPESESHARIDALHDQVKGLEAELKTLEGRLANRDPNLVVALRKENQELRNRSVKLIRAYFALVSEATAIRDDDPRRTELETLRTAAMQYFQKNNVNPEIWKNLVY